MLLAAAPVAIHKVRQRVQRVDSLYEGVHIHKCIHLPAFLLNNFFADFQDINLHRRNFVLSKKIVNKGQ